MPFGASRNARALEPSEDLIVRAFDRRAQRSRSDVLVRSIDWRATAGDIDDWSRAALHQLIDARLAPGSIVAISAPSGPAFLAAFLAVRRALCPALLIDRRAPAAERARVLTTMGARAVLICAVDNATGVFDARVESVTDPVQAMARGLPATARPDWAVIKLTSGSTGQPRGVAVSAEALLADEDALATTMGLRADDRLLAAVPMSHSYGFTTLAMACLVRGLQLIMPADDGPFAPIHAAERGEATVLPTVPAYVQAVLRMSQPPPWPSSVRLFFTAGAPLLPATAAEFRHSAGRPLHVFYGSSECGGICFDRAGDAGERGTVGTPVDGVSISWSPLNPTDVTTLATTTNGLLTVRSAAVGDTYMPAADPRLGDGRFVTADLAEWRGNEIALLGRADRILNIRGFKVDPDEVERIVAELPGVDDVIVTAAPGPDGTSTVVRAVIACRPGVIDADAVMTWCRPRLAEHKMPRRIVFIRELPRTPRGKIDHAALEHA